MSGTGTDEEVEIIDLTNGISASTSPMFSPPPRSRPRAKAKVLDLALESSSEEEKGELAASSSTNARSRRPRRAQRRAIVEEEDDDEDFIAPWERDGGAKKEAAAPTGSKTTRPRLGNRRAIVEDDDEDRVAAAQQNGDEGTEEKSEATSKPTTNRTGRHNFRRLKADDTAPKQGEGIERLLSSPSASSRSEPPHTDRNKLEQAYLKARRSGVKKRSFDLSRIPPSEVIPTGRTIKRMGAWSGRWPALREFLQNTIDHLGLLDPKSGRRHGALRLETTPGNSRDELATFRFVCGDEAVCTIVASEDELVIDQLYTFPIAPRALDTGVPDLEKSGTSSAGGFGDGFKTAAVALLALGKDFGSLTWDFYAQKQKITWSFEGATRSAVGTFAKCQVLQVRIERNDESSPDEEEENTMRQTIKVRGIGRSFVEQATPRLAVFWDLDEPTLISSGKSGGDFLGPASAQPAIAGGVLGLGIKPESGVYVKGIWVRKAKISESLMCFFGRRLEVTGRDRNDVDDEDLVNAVVHVFRYCTDLGYLRSLLTPLRGRAHNAGSSGGESGSSSSSSSSRPSRRYGQRGSDSWLLKSPRFLNQILEQHKEFILHDVLGVPPGAIYVSSKTTKNSDPFIKWASGFLSKCGCPLEPIEPGANRYLFQEVSELELTERCVAMLKQQKEEKGGNAVILSKAFRKILSFMGLGRTKVFFSPHVVVAFVHDRDIYVPAAPLTRELLVKVLNVCQCHLDGADGERFSCLMQAIFETLPPGGTRILATNDIDTAVDRAKGVCKENKNFLVKPSCEAPCSSSSARKPPPLPHAITAEIDLTEEDSSPPTEDVREGAEGNGSSNAADLLRQIAQVTRLAEGIRKRRQRTGDGDDDGADLPPIIPEADFGHDDAGADSCLRPSSELQVIQVGTSLGGGEMLCDARAAESVRDGIWNEATQARIAALRNILGEAIDLVRRSIPSLGPLLGRIRHGYDSSNTTYEAFCDGRQIVVNLHSYMPKLRDAAPGASRPRTLVHDFVVMVTHELAHFLEPRAGHGPAWRDTHMQMVAEVMALLSSSSGGGANADGGSLSRKRRKQG